MEQALKVLVVGAMGRMGRETVQALRKAEDMKLVGAVDLSGAGVSLAELTGDPEDTGMVKSDLLTVIQETKPQVMVDFTNPGAVFKNVRTALMNSVSCVVGTTGLDESQLSELDQVAQEYDQAVLVIPNFAIGAILMMKFAAQAARYFPDVEIIELHHDLKLDAPSGTAVKTAEMIAAGRETTRQPLPGQYEKYPGARGGKVAGVNTHSVRLPGYVAHQEVLFGSQGQALTIRHDAFNRECFMPGVLLSIRKTRETKGLVYGMEHLI